jgi:hypothetical protein
MVTNTAVTSSKLKFLRNFYSTKTVDVACFLLYRVGHEKVARVRRLDWWVKANNMRSRRTSGGGGGEMVTARLSPPPPLVLLDRMLLTLTHQSILRTRATFSWPTLYISVFSRLHARTQKLSFFGGGVGAEPVAVYNLCFILKIVSQISCSECNWNTTLFATVFMYKHMELNFPWIIRLNWSHKLSYFWN